MKPTDRALIETALDLAMLKAHGLTKGETRTLLTAIQIVRELPQGTRRVRRDHLTTRLPESQMEMGE